METITKQELEKLYRLTEKFNAVDDVTVKKEVRTLSGKTLTITHRAIIQLFQTIVHEMMQTK